MSESSYWLEFAHRRASRRQVLRGSAALAAIGAFGCQPATTPSGGQSSPAANVEQRAVFGYGNLVDTLDQHAQIGQNGRRYDLFDCLVLPDQQGNPTPAIAMRWTLVDPTTWEFSLRTDMTFHDGSKLTAEDVKYSYERIMNPANKLAAAARIQTIESVAVTNPSTVVIKTKAPDPILLRRLQAIAIYPKAYTERVGATEFGINAVGSGPFKLKEWRPGDSLSLTAFDEHPFRKPILREVVFRAVPAVSARIAGLQTGELDFANLISLEQAEKLRTDGFGLTVRTAGTTHGFFMDSVLNDRPVEGPTADRRVRQAINYAIDKETINKQIYRGFTNPTGQLIQRESFGYNPSISAYRYDPTRAKAMLAEAGYPNGFQTRIDAATFVAEFQPLTLFIQQNLRDVGIQAEINLMSDQAVWRDKFYNTQPRAPLFIAPLSNNPALDADFAINWFWSKNASNRHINNADFDRIYEASLVEMDETKRKGLLQQALTILHDEAYFLYVVDGAQADAYASKKLAGVEMWVEADQRLDKVYRIA